MILESLQNICATLTGTIPISSSRSESANDKNSDCEPTIVSPFGLRAWDSSLEQCAQFTLEEVAEHNMPDDCWLVIYDKVYDVTEFLHEHPAGDYIIMEHAGRDATFAFRSAGHGTDSWDMLKKYFIGVLVPHERMYGPTTDLTT